HGRYYRLTNARNEPKGPQRPHPPIVIGGDGERRTLRTVAAFAQHWNFHGKGPEVLTRKLDILRSYCAELDRDPRDILVSGNFWLDSAQHIGQVVDEVAAMEAAGMQLAVIYIAGEAGQPSLLSPLADALSPLRDSVSDS
ncbi:MAG: LLM class flavin-dependent oxidoreductase, partial [Kutzneria sp.]|nr:LLM class flavin-dependent oxidoreductase [Kutzneria sp.]